MDAAGILRSANPAAVLPVQKMCRCKGETDRADEMNRSPQIWLDWKRREARRCAVARIDVRWLTIAQALASGLSLAVAQRVIQWQQRTSA
jgi:hypothetical protein